MKEADRRKLWDIVNAVNAVEKTYTTLSENAQEEFHEHVMKYMADLAQRREKAEISHTKRMMFSDPVNSVLSYLANTISDEDKEKYPQTTGCSEVYTYKGSEFRYDFDNRVVEYGEYLTKKQVEKRVADAEKESGETYTDREKRLIFGKPGWNPVDCRGLSIDHWIDTEARNEYLDEYLFQLNEEVSIIAETEFCPQPKKNASKKGKTR